MNQLIVRSAVMEFLNRWTQVWYNSVFFEKQIKKKLQTFRAEIG